MDLSIFNTIVGIVGVVVGIIGVIVGIIGGISLKTVRKIKNKTKAGDNANVQNAQVINNGLDSYAVIKLSTETTRDELVEIIERIQSVETTVEKIPRFHTDPDEPKDPKDGDIWLKTQ